jgi:hypothetical protein
MAGYKIAYPEELEEMRCLYATNTLVYRWFRDMQPLFTGVHPKLIFNFDEIMVDADARWEVIVKCNKKAFHITLGLCVSSQGKRPPPVFVLSCNQSTCFEEEQLTDEFLILNSANGWMTTKFVEWLDWYRQKLTLALQLLAQHNVRVISLPPHMTHAMQPIDVA